MDTKPIHAIATKLRRLASEIDALATSMALSGSEDEAGVLIEDWSAEAIERYGPMVATTMLMASKQ